MDARAHYALCHRAGSKDPADAVREAINLKELPRDIEADEPGVVVDAAARDLAERGAEAVREIELELVAARAPLDAEAHLIHARRIAAHARRDFADEIHLRQDAQPRA